MGDATFIGGNRTKAGLPESGGLERSRIDEIIKEASKGSKYYQYQEKRELMIVERIQRMAEKKAELESDPGLLARTESDLIRWKEEMESGCDLTSTIMCIDMDAFFAAVECLDHPEWASIPMAVGGESMLSTANYEARKYGVVSAMPGFIARKLCPNLLIVPGNFAKYRAAAAKFHPIFKEYDPHFSHFSLDEATLDLTKYLAEHPEHTAESLAAEIRGRVFETTGLTCSAGIAPNKLLAKVCSNVNKPNGQSCLQPTKEAVAEFLSKAGLTRMSGIGKVTAKILRDLLGAETCKDLWDQRVWVRLLFTPIQGEFLLRCSLGLGGSADPEGEESPSMRQSISLEQTFRPVTDLPSMLKALRPLCAELAEQIADEGILGKTVSIKTKTADFDVSTRSITLRRFVSSEDDLYLYASQLLTKYQPASMRLLGVRLSGLAEQCEVTDIEDISKFVHHFDPDAVKCPVCLKPITSKPDDEATINNHIDDCLTRQALRLPRDSGADTATPSMARKPKDQVKGPQLGKHGTTTTLSQFFPPKRTKKN